MSTEDESTDAALQQPLCGFDAAAFLLEFQAAAREAAAPTQPALPAANFFPEDSTCTLCQATPLYSHTAKLLYCCGTAGCRGCVRAITGGLLRGGPCPFCTKAFPTDFAGARRLLRAHAGLDPKTGRVIRSVDGGSGEGAAWAKHELACGSWEFGDGTAIGDAKARNFMADESSVKNNSSDGGYGGDADADSAGLNGERLVLVEEAAASGLAGAMVSLALEKHLTGPSRTATSSRNLAEAQRLLVGAAVQGHPMALYHCAELATLHAQPLDLGRLPAFCAVPGKPASRAFFPTDLVRFRLSSLARFGLGLDAGAAPALQDRCVELLRLAAKRLCGPALVVLLSLASGIAEGKLKAREATLAAQTPGAAPPAMARAAAAAAAGEKASVLASLPKDARALLLSPRFSPSPSDVVTWTEALSTLRRLSGQSLDLLQPAQPAQLHQQQKQQQHQAQEQAQQQKQQAQKQQAQAQAQTAALQLAASSSGGCSACGIHGTFLRCSRCQSAAYCGKDCQRAHWVTGGHKQACVPVAAAATHKA